MTRRSLLLSLLAGTPALVSQFKARSRRVEIVAGPLRGVSGTLHRREGDQMVITIQVINRSVNVWVPAKGVRIAA